MKQMPILTFNASTEGKNKDEFPLIKEPFQIMPGGRSKLSSRLISQFPECQNKDIIIHASYITRPFSEVSTFISRENLKHYLHLCERLGTKNMLIHLPTNVKEFSNFSLGLEMIIKILSINNIICHFEIAPLSKELRDYLEINKENAYDKIIEFVEKLFSQIPEKFKTYFKFVPDTAHLFANGVSGENIINFIDKFKSKINYIHLNGCKSAQFAPDKHTPIYKSNKIENVDEIMKYLVKNKFILITENSTEKGTREEWVKFCEKYKIEIVKPNDVYMY